MHASCQTEKHRLTHVFAWCQPVSYLYACNDNHEVMVGIMMMMMMMVVVVVVVVVVEGWR